MGIPAAFKTALITGATTALVLAASAHAEVITAEYTGTFSNTTGWPAGVTLSGAYTFDSEALGTVFDANTVHYPALSHVITLRTADGTPAICSVTNPRIQVINDRPSVTLLVPGLWPAERLHLRRVAGDPALHFPVEGSRKSQ